MSAKMFYQQIVPLNDKTHAQLRLKPVCSYTFAAHSNSVPVLAGEFGECARHYPIIFSGHGEAVVPAALLGLRDGENLFVDTHGQWIAPYIPAFIRRYPFALGAGEGDQMVVCIDPLADAVSEHDGDRLFEDGVPGAVLQKAMGFLREFQAAVVQTTRWAARIESLDLLRDADSLAQLNNGQQFRLSGLRVVDEQRLESLDDAVVLELVKSGVMKLIHAHLISLGNLSVLIDRLSARTLPKSVGAAKTRVRAKT